MFCDCHFRKLLFQHWVGFKKYSSMHISTDVLVSFLDNIFVGVLLLVAIGGIFVAYKSLISRKAPNKKNGRPSNTPRNDVCMVSRCACIFSIKHLIKLRRLYYRIFFHEVLYRFHWLFNWILHSLVTFNGSNFYITWLNWWPLCMNSEGKQ